MAIKKFHLFAGCQYYPEGGLSDYIGSYETEKEALIEATNGEYVGDQYDWWEIAETLEDGSLIVFLDSSQDRSKN
jgi:hypothetical protein